MKRELIFNELSSLDIIDQFGFTCKMSGEYFSYLYNDEFSSYTIRFRCQNYGDTILFNPQGLLFYNNAMNQLFSQYLIDELKPFDDTEFTLVKSPNDFESAKSLSSFEVASGIELQNLLELLPSYITEVNQGFIQQITRYKEVGDEIGKHNFDEHTNTLVGGKFPVQIMKKLFFLFKGNQEERYREYKVGLEGLLRRFEEKKPDQSDRIKMFWKGYEYFINKLEQETIPPLT